MPKHQNKIEKLLAELCPEGVEFKELGEVCEIADNKRKPVKSSLRVAGNIPYYGANNIQDYVEGFTHEGDYVLIAEDGSASLENYSIQFASGKFWANNHVHVVRGDGDLHNKFLFHYLRNMNFVPYLTGGTRAKLTKGKMLEIKVPFPPRAIQEEIVKILDNFTKLEAELEAELEARKKQYEYYRNELLTFDRQTDRVRWATLGEIGSMIRGNGLQKKDFTESGVGCIHYGQVYTYYGTFTHETKSFVSPKLATNLKKVNKGDLVITSTSETVEDVCKAVAWLGEDEIVTGGHATIFKHHENPKYLSYYFQTPNFSDQKRKYAKGTKVIDVSAKDLAKIKIPIPPMDEQERIVAVLDKFDALVNDISAGLPAELYARRKQYEYYREKLLTFQEKP